MLPFSKLLGASHLWCLKRHHHMPWTFNDPSVWKPTSLSLGKFSSIISLIIIPSIFSKPFQNFQRSNVGPSELILSVLILSPIICLSLILFLSVLLWGKCPLFYLSDLLLNSEILLSFLIAKNFSLCFYIWYLYMLVFSIYPSIHPSLSLSYFR